MMFGAISLALSALALGEMQMSTVSRCEYTVREICGGGERCSEFRSQGEYLLVPSLATLEKAFPSAVLSTRPAAVQRCDQRVARQLRYGRCAAVPISTSGKRMADTC